ncbi:MAG: HEAT repeat domain-containing protein [Candidatus Wallbacteria bacterium]|nr:HEAT repeat domain-containing protein [Candidatus Wallbacteria bacterium]
MVRDTAIHDIGEKLAEDIAEVRYSALRELAVLEHVFVLKPRLLEICLYDSWGPNRSEAVRALAALWPDADVKQAFAACLDAEPYVANTVVEILALRLDSEAIELLHQRFRSAQNAKLRYSILQAFCNARECIARDFVLNARGHVDEDERVRALSLSLLARTGDLALKDLFVARLKDDSQRVRAGAIEALSEICSPEELLELLPPYLDDSSNRVRANAMIPLLKAGYRIAESRLRDMVAHTCNLFRSSAAYVLGEMAPTVQVVSHLDDLARDADPVVRNRALASVERLGLRPPPAGATPASQSIGI